MLITICPICDKPITDESEYYKTEIGLVCSDKCLEKTDGEDSGDNPQ